MSTDCTFQSSQFFDHLSMHFGVVDYFWASALATADCRPPSWNQITDKRHAPPLMKRGGWIPLGLLSSYLYTLWSTFTITCILFMWKNLGYFTNIFIFHDLLLLIVCICTIYIYIFFFNLGITLNLNWNT